MVRRWGQSPYDLANRKFKQITMAGADMAAGSKFPQNVALRIYVSYIHP